MFLSENEIDTRLTELRRRRDLVEREIADLLLYRDLGRRLAGVQLGATTDSNSANPLPGMRNEDGSDGTTDPTPDVSDGLAETPQSPALGVQRDTTGHRKAPVAHRPSSVPPVAFEDDPVAARRYGRAILDAAVEGLREAGRPLHAGEILERVIARGFTVPGQDPVAALNTRLWKRSGPGGPLRRLGDAVYALAEPPAA